MSATTITMMGSDGTRAYAVALSLCRVAIELDQLAQDIRELGADTVDAEWLFGPGEGHALGAAVGLRDVLGAKRSEAERARRYQRVNEVAA